MTLGDIEFFIVEAFRGIKRSGLMSLVAIAIVTVSLFIFGFFLIFISNLGHIASNIGTRLDMVAYVDRDLSSDSSSRLQLSIARINGVDEVRYVSKQEAWRNFKEDFGSLNFSIICSRSFLLVLYIFKLSASLLGSPGE